MQSPIQEISFMFTIIRLHFQCILFCQNWFCTDTKMTKTAYWMSRHEQFGLTSSSKATGVKPAVSVMYFQSTKSITTHPQTDIHIHSAPRFNFLGLHGKPDFQAELKACQPDCTTSFQWEETGRRGKRTDKK